jgi:hypothetical protein
MIKTIFSFRLKGMAINVGVLIFLGMWIGLYSPVVLAKSAASSPLSSTDPEQTPETLYAVRTQEIPKIDGILDEKVWQTPPIKKDFISYDPLYGDKLPQETLVWAAYDNKSLYFAFMCNDPEPERIQTSITKRDNVFNDDWVSVSIDAVGNGQTAYVLYVNPSGIQGDSLFSTTGAEDISPDFVWESAAKLTDKGYQVEIRLPLKSIRFKTGKEVKMGVLFRRKVNRSGYFAAWPDIPPGHGILNRQTQIILKGLKKQLKLEILPSLTHNSTRDRISQEEWSERDTVTEFGIGLKYGITSSITADLTINPDFSQVESDAFQVQVNLRYPLFFREKRPFFMEGADIFNFYTLANGYFPIPVHTRQIVDPSWGAKLTGNLGKMSFGILSAGDEWPGQPWEWGINPNEGKTAFFGIARGKYSLGKDNYAGFLYSGSEFADNYNRVFGTDFAYRIGKNQRISASLLHSMSGDENGRHGDASDSSNLNLSYVYNTKPLGFSAAFEHIGTEFRMDSSYILRRGINSGFFWLGIGFYPDPKKIPWLKMVSPDLKLQYTHDLYTKRKDIYFEPSLFLIMIKEGIIVLTYRAIQENWQEQEFKLNQLSIYGGLRFNKWLKVVGNYTYGEHIFYTADPAFKGKGHRASLTVILQPSKKIFQGFTYLHSDLSRSGEEIYDVNILYSKTTYQFNKYFFLRSIIQYDSYQKLLLTDFLASFTLIPGTVVHVGYGGLYQNRKWQNTQWIYGEGDMINTKRSLFAKVSYLWRF